jgi:hypothetical protein
VIADVDNLHSNPPPPRDQLPPGERPPGDDRPPRSIRLRQAAYFALVGIFAAAFIALVLVQQNMIDLDTIGLSAWELLFITLGTGAVCLALAWLVWRCPACGGSFWGESDPVTCYHCKARLR